jgi:hypothetical protein
MAIRKEATVQHGFSQEEITEAVKATLESLWGCRKKAPGVFESDVGFSLVSWGERVTVDVRKEGIVEIASESKLPTTLVDWGKNLENLSKVLDGLKDALSASGLAEAKPEAYELFLSNEPINIGRSSTGKGVAALLISLVVILAVVVFGVFLAVFLLALAGVLYFLLAPGIS